jgi:purine nucleoside phosphorylase
MSNYIVTKIDTDFTPETHTVGSSSAQSSAIITGSGLIRICTTTHAHIKFGANPTATEEDLMLPSDHVEIFAFKSGEKVAFIHHQGGSGEINISAVD